MNTETKERLAEWTEKFGLNIHAGPENDKLKWALDPTLSPKTLDLEETGELLFVLSSYHYTLSAEQGRVFAIMRHDNCSFARAKLNIIKPQVDSLELKISVIKKLFDRRANDHRRVNV